MGRARHSASNKKRQVKHPTNPQTPNNMSHQISALEARNLAQQAEKSTSLSEKIGSAIKKAAQEGKTSIYLESLSEADRIALKNLGYNVEGSYDPRDNVSVYQIKW